jgi:hypothetical protein
VYSHSVQRKIEQIWDTSWKELWWFAIFHPNVWDLRSSQQCHWRFESSGMLLKNIGNNSPTDFEQHHRRLEPSFNQLFMYIQKLKMMRNSSISYSSGRITCNENRYNGWLKWLYDILITANSTPIWVVDKQLLHNWHHRFIHNL